MFHGSRSSQTLILRHREGSSKQERALSALSYRGKDKADAFPQPLGHRRPKGGPEPWTLARVEPPYGSRQAGRYSRPEVMTARGGGGRDVTVM